MFERFTGQARQVLWLAEQEAQRVCHDYVGTEHILLGVLAEGSGSAARMLQEQGVHLDQARQEVAEHSPPGTAPAAWEKLPLTPGAKRAIGFAEAEAESFHHAGVAPEHLLLGLMVEEESDAARVLTRLGLSLSELRRRLAQLPPSANRDHQVQESAGGARDPSPRILDGVLTQNPVPELCLPLDRAQPAAAPGSDARRLSANQLLGEFQAVDRQLRFVQAVLGSALGIAVGVSVLGCFGAVLGLGLGIAVAILRNEVVGGFLGGGAGFVFGLSLPLPNQPKSGLFLLMTFLGAFLGVLCFGGRRIFAFRTGPPRRRE